jgi:hypothetical protein
MMERSGEESRKAQAQKYHDATLAWDQNYEEHQYIPPKPATPGPGTAGGPLRSEQPSPMQSILQPAPNAPAMSSQPPAMNSYQPTEGAPATPGSQGEGMMSLADFYKSRGLQPPRGSENIWGKPKTQAKSESAQTIAALKEAGALARTKDTNDTKADVAETAAAAKKDVAKTTTASKEKLSKENAAAKKDLADKANDLHASMLKTSVGSKEYIAAKKAYTDFMKAHPILGEFGMGPENPDAKPPEKGPAKIGRFTVETAE